MLDPYIPSWEMGLMSLSPAFVARDIVFSKLTNLRLLSLVSWIWILPAMYLIYRCWIYPFYFSPLRNIPTVPCNPLWGHFFTLIREEAGVPHRSWHQKHGNLVRFFLPLGIEVISVADEEALKQITVKDPYNFPYPLRVYVLLCSILGKGLVVAQGKAHTLQRKTLAPAFSNASIKSLSPVFWRKALLLTRIWRQGFVSEGKQYRSIDVFEWTTRVTLDIIGEGAFGVNIDSLRNPEASLHRAYRLALNTEYNLLQGLRSVFTFLKYIPMRVNSDLKLSRQIIKTEAAHIVDCKPEPNSNAPDGKDIMSLIIKTNQSMSPLDGQMTLATLKDQVRTFLGAGHDTSATAVAWSLLLLSQNPAVQIKLREEIRAHMPSLCTRTSRDPDNNAVSQEEEKEAEEADDELPDPDHLPYLDAITRESLRLIPPIPLTVRQTRSSTTLASHLIPPGTLTFVPINAINRLPCHWGPDPDAFDPDRWSRLPPDWAPTSYLTFSQGPKSCIARKFAETELKVLLCALVARFEFGIEEGTLDAAEWKTWNVVARPRWGVRLRVGLVG